ncbi:hypothetical protein EV421DRAFT_1739205 [Armillaria borealis]|uniref:Uncharacterized protein n=1 Tax=Armillaria borealis TaxID=47425 RepID=A0AA39J6V8_9AGAR|nr:hypothetical protein EV421DRAFT_1739205 [Armillaria borealis]
MSAGRQVPMDRPFLKRRWFEVDYDLRVSWITVGDDMHREERVNMVHRVHGTELTAKASFKLATYSINSEVPARGGEGSASKHRVLIFSYGRGFYKAAQMLSAPPPSSTTTPALSPPAYSSPSSPPTTSSTPVSNSQHSVRLYYDEDGETMQAVTSLALLESASSSAPRLLLGIGERLISYPHPIMEKFDDSLKARAVSYEYCPR